MATTEHVPLRERRPSSSAPIVDIQGAVGPAGITRPKHKRTFTGFGASEIKSIEGVCVCPWSYPAGWCCWGWTPALFLGAIDR